MWTPEELSAALQALEVPSAEVHDEALVLDIEREASALGLIELQMRARLVRARALLGRDEPTTIARLLWEVNEWATEHENRVLLAESHRQLVGCSMLADPAAALDHAVRAMELLDDTTPPRVRVENLSVLAMALSMVGSYEAAREPYTEAQQILVSGRVSDGSEVYLLMHVLNNLTVNEHLAGEDQAAWEVAERMLALASTRAFPMNAAFFHTVSMVQIGLGRLDEAERTLQTCLDDYDPRVMGHTEDLAEILLGLAEVQRRRGDTATAQVSLDQCRAFCNERGLSGTLLRVQQEQAELYAAVGQSQRAFEAYKGFHAEAEALNVRERSAQARIRQAMLQTTEARQEAERFREQARRDPLTGVHNRSFVDEELPRLLDRTMQSGTPLSIALVDLDHFKGINDSLSHDVGDQVLVLVARLVAAAVGSSTEPTVAGSGVVARMGGDELLVVLPGVEPARAARQLEALRISVSAYRWAPVTGDLPVTVSIGGATARPGVSTQSELLGRADQNLYAAKGEGRNRVCTDLGAFTDQPDT